MVRMWGRGTVLCAATRGLTRALGARRGWRVRGRGEEKARGWLGWRLSVESAINASRRFDSRADAHYDHVEEGPTYYTPIPNASTTSSDSL
ncbi:hypothetical protein BJY52DRAFT_1246699, partial [Lactarius psammicola]